MKLIFCISNLFVPATLTLIKENQDEEILVYTDQIGIYNLFNSIDLQNIKVYFAASIIFSKNIFRFYRFLINRQQILDYLKGFEFKEIYFFHNTFGYLEDWLIKKLSDKSEIYYFPIFNELPFKRNYSRKSLKEIILLNSVYSINFIPLWTGERYIYRPSESFFTRIDSIEIRKTINDKFITKVLEDNFKFGKDKEFILLTGTVVELNQVDKNEYITKIDNLIKCIGPKKIIAKPHPRHPNRFSCENDLELIPPYLPANLLFSRFRIYIGYSSTVLTEAANNGLLAISLIDYFNPISETRKHNYKQYLLKNLHSGKIFFPSSLESVLDILDRYQLE